MKKRKNISAILVSAVFLMGSLISEENIDDTSDRWYPNGDTTSEYFFMLVQTSGEASNIGLDLTFCKGQGEAYLFSATDLQAEKTKPLMLRERMS